MRTITAKAEYFMARQKLPNTRVSRTRSRELAADRTRPSQSCVPQDIERDDDLTFGERGFFGNQISFNRHPERSGRKSTYGRGH